MTDLDAVHRAMLELEDQSDDPDPKVSVGVVIAKLLGVEHNEAFEQMLVRETRRTHLLFNTRYGPYGARPTPETFIGLGLLQGVTLARAVDKASEGGT